MINLTVEQSNLLYLTKGKTKDETIKNLKKEKDKIDYNDYFAQEMGDLIEDCIKIINGLSEEEFVTTEVYFED